MEFKLFGKRRTYWTHRALVAVTIFLLSVDPVAACRLWERRCGQVCCQTACQSAPRSAWAPSCSSTVPATESTAPPPPEVPSPSDRSPTPPEPPTATPQALAPPLPQESRISTELDFSRSLEGSEREPQPSLPVPDLSSVPAQAPEALPAEAPEVVGDLPQATTPRITAPPEQRTTEVPWQLPSASAEATPSVQPLPSVAPVAPTREAQAGPPTLPDLPDQAFESNAPRIAPAEPGGRASATSDLPPMPSDQGPSPARRPQTVQPQAPTAPMPLFPPVEDDPFAPARPQSPGKTPAASSESTAPLPEGAGKSSSGAPAVIPPSSARPAIEDDDPFAPARPQTRVVPGQATPVGPGSEPDAPLPELAFGADGRLPLRTWVDDTGQFRVQAQLLQVLDGRVRLLKTTGRTTTVPLARLSPADRAYVAAAVALHGERLQMPQVAVRPSASR